MRPNILLIMADQFVWDGIGQVGGWTHTPNLDRLYQEGVGFENCWTASPLCLPARASLLTGTYPSELNLMDNMSDGLNEQSSTWVQELRAAGYETGLFGKLHAYKWPSDLRIKEPLVRTLGFDHVYEIPGPRTYGKKKSIYYDYLEEKGLLELYNQDLNERYARSVYDTEPTPLDTEDYADVFLMNQTLDWLEHHDNSKNWFLQVSFGGPHEPWDTPAGHVDFYKNRTMPSPLKKPSDKADRRKKGVFDELLSGKYDPFLNNTIEQMTPQDVERVRKSYAGHITLIDEQIGRLLETLENMNELDNTVVIFTSDHGEQNGDYGLLFKQTFLNSSDKVPLVFRAPGRIAVRMEPQDVSLIDVGATIVEFAGAEINRGSHAKSLMPYLRGEECRDKRDYIISQIYGETMVMNHSYKAVFNASGEIYMLFDRKNDQKEEYNLAGTGLEKEMEHWLNQIPITCLPES